MIQQNESLSSKDFNKGLVTRADILKQQFDQSPNTMDIKWYFDGAIGKRLGSSTMNSVAIGSTAIAGFTIDSSATLTTSLQAFWKMNEVAGTRSDSFSSNHLSDGNTVDSVTGIRNLAALFAAANSESLVKQTTSPLETGANFSISTWVYLNSTSSTAQRTIVGKRDDDVDAATVLLLHCDGVDASTTFTDSAPSPHTMTANGNAQIDTAQSKFGTASYLGDGTGDWLSTPNSTDFDLGTTGGNDFTVDFWVRFSAVATAVFVAPCNTGSNTGWLIQYNNSTQRLEVFNGSGTVRGNTWVPSANTWYHVAVVRKSTNTTMYIDGTSIGTVSDGDWSTDGEALDIGATNHNGSSSLNGWMDEIRISKGVARWSANFTPPTKAYGIQEYEYWLFVNTNNQPTFRVSSTGTNHTASVSSAGSLLVGSWYNIIAWHSNNSHVGISVNNVATTTSPYTTGVKVGSAPVAFGALSDSVTARANYFFDGRIDESGFWKKVLNASERADLYGGGTGNTYSGGASGFGWAMFDFGASSLRHLVVAAGTGIMASSNLGATLFAISTSRTQNYQYFERSKNVLIATSDSYDVPLYWAGSVGTFAATLAPNSAPSAKYSVNYQGFLILLNFQNSNGTLRQRGFAYADENTQLTSAWTDSFDIPSSQDDEITTAFILSKFLYISTKTRLYRVAYVGGNPDWSYLKVADWGFVPRTVKIMTLKDQRFAIGLDWNRRIRAFGGSDDVFISDNVENDNNLCDFAMKKISLAGSGLVISHAEVDQIEQEYRLNVAIGSDSSQTTHALLVNGRTLAMYPYSNQQFQASCMAESGGKQFLMAVDRSGFVHVLNSGNRDVATRINEVYDSPLIFGDNPSQVLKSQNINAYFKVDSCGKVYYRDRVNLSNQWGDYRILGDLIGNEQDILAKLSLDVPQTFNTYQFQMSSSGNANPWKMTHWDLVGRGKGMGQG